MAIDYSELAFPKGPSRFSEKQRRRAEEAKAMRDCYRTVDLRDQMRCRVTGVSVNPYAVDPLERGEHHHLQFRSRGGQHTTDNVCLISAKTHQLIHDGKLKLEGDADQRDPLTRKLNGIAVSRAVEHGWQIEKWC